MDLKEPQWTRLEDKHIRGFIDPGLRPLLTARFFEDPGHQITAGGGHVVKASRVRWVATLPVQGGTPLFIKKFKVIDLWQRFSYVFRPSRARKEWFTSLFLTQKGILTPRPLGVLERRKHGIVTECFFIAEALEGASNLRDFCKNRFDSHDPSEARDQILRLLAETTRKIHDSGLFHKDLHSGNFLLVDDRSLYLVDLHQTRRQARVNKAKRFWNIGQIFNSLDFMLDDGARRLFLLTYGRGEAPFGMKLDICLVKVGAMVQKMVKRRRKSRAKRCLKESSLFTVARRAGLRIYRRREFGEDDLMVVLEDHRDMVRSQRGKLLKYSPKTIVSMVGTLAGNGRRICVKEYRYDTISDRLRHLFWPPRGRASWTASNVLFSRGISLQKPLAYAERRKLGFLRQAFCVTDSPSDHLELDRYLIQRFQGPARRDLRRFIRQFGQWVGSLHREGIYHRDLKTCNILVQENQDGWRFSLIDLEDVILNQRIGVGKIRRNLVQINCSIPKSFSYGDRMRFLSGYLKAHPVLMDKRAFAKRVLEESRRRGIVYVSPEGDVIEEFD